MRYCPPVSYQGAEALNPAAQWRVRDGRPGSAVPHPYRDWVVDTGSLTARLRTRCPGAFRVRLIGQTWARPALEEAWRLEIPRRRLAWVREVALCCADQPLILARTVIPGASLGGGNEALRHLGTRPLGELLFRGAGSRREPMEVARLRRGDWLARRLGPTAGASLQGCWARRVVHYMHGSPLLVAEVFLPPLFAAQGVEPDNASIRKRASA